MMLIDIPRIERIIDSRLTALFKETKTEVFNTEVDKKFRGDSWVVFTIEDVRFPVFTFNRQMNIGEYDLSINVNTEKPKGTTDMANCIINDLIKYRDRIIRRVEYKGMSRERSQPLKNPLYFRYLDFTLRTQ